jgi:multiple sugar transport system ATP-binding protein
MNAGKLQQVGTPLEVYDRPANVFVAQFIGTPPMNFFRAGALPFSIAEPDTLVGIRPESLSRSGPVSIPATVDLVEMVGHEAVVHLRHNETPFIATFDAHDAPRVGEKTTIGVDVARVHLFDPKTEARM